MSRLDLLLWIVLPYAAITIFIVGHIWRYHRDRLTWTTRSTQLLERHVLRWGVLLFHWGLLAVFAGHIMGILIPKSFTNSIGLGEDGYHWLSAIAGSVAGIAMIVGLLILIFRRAGNRRVAATTTRVDLVTYELLLAVVVLGMVETLGFGLIGGGYDYRESVSLWFRSLFALDPDVKAMASASFIYQLHAIAAWFLIALWPFSRLVHAWSIPFGYLGRAYMLFRSRTRPAYSTVSPAAGPHNQNPTAS